MDTTLRGALQDFVDFYSSDSLHQERVYGKFNIDPRSVAASGRLMEAIRDKAIAVLEAKP